MTFIRPEELNKFRLILAPLLGSNVENVVYEETVFDVSTIILSAHIANLSAETRRVTIELEKYNNGPKVVMLYNAAIPPEESLNPFSGRVVLETGDKFIVKTNASDNDLNIALSVLENANS